MIVPGNVSVTFRVVVAVAMFDILENDYGIGTELVLTFDEDAYELNEPIRAQV